MEDGISDMEAMRLIETESGGGSGGDKWKEDEGENVLRLNPEEEVGGGGHEDRALPCGGCQTVGSTPVRGGMDCGLDQPPAYCEEEREEAGRSPGRGRGKERCQERPSCQFSLRPH